MFWKSSVSILLIAVLAGCGTTGVTKNPNASYTVSSQYGALNGSWDRAQREAVSKAQEFCENMGLQYNFIKEDRTGVVGWSPQQSSINFSCSQKTSELLKIAENECNNDYSTLELDPIRNKVELVRRSAEDSVPFAIAANESYPTADERLAIAKWAKLREVCVDRIHKITDVELAGLTPLHQTYRQQIQGYGKQMDARVGELIVALYQLKLNYSEFALKRYEITRSLTSTQREIKASMLLADREAQIKAQQLAEMQMQNNLLMWSNYTQTVNARQPQPQPVDANVRLRTNCTSSKIGNMVSTSCN